MQRVTVHLRTNAAPGGVNWIQGRITQHTTAGVWIESDWPARGSYFFPAHEIVRVEYL